MQGQRFGASSERTQVISGQFSLFNEAEELAESKAVEPDLEQITYQRQKQAGKRELVYIPAQYKVVEHIQAVYSCRRYERKSDQVPMKKGAVPAPLIPGSGIVSPSLLAHILHADETTLMVLREPGRKAQQKSYVWVYRTSGDASHPVMLYDYQPSRAGESPCPGWPGLLRQAVPAGKRFCGTGAVFSGAVPGLLGTL